MKFDKCKKLFAAPTLFAFLLFISFLVVACNPSMDEPSPSGDIRADLATYPSPPVSLKTTNFLVTLFDAGGTPVSDANVVLDLSMPGMYHGENRPPCRLAEKGEYLCQGYFVMGGLWEVVVEVNGTPLRTVSLNVAEE